VVAAEVVVTKAELAERIGGVEFGVEP